MMDLEAPDVDQDLAYQQEQQGVVFDDDRHPLAFDTEGSAVAAFAEGVLMQDVSACARIMVAGPDRLTFLNNQTSNQLLDLKAGDSVETVVLTSTGRVLDVVRVVAQEESVLLIGSPGMGNTLVERLKKYIFPADDVKLRDITSVTRLFTLSGPDSATAIASVAPGLDDDKLPPNRHLLAAYKNTPLRIGNFTQHGPHVRGYTLLAADEAAGDLWLALHRTGAVPCGKVGAERIRVAVTCRPAVGAELGEQVNALEAGLANLVALDKGCYMGQETLAKVARSGKLKQQIVAWEASLKVQVPQTAEGLKFFTGEGELGVVAGEPVQAEDGAKVGSLTSVSFLDDGRVVGLAMVRTRGQQLDGMKVTVGGVGGTLKTLPYGSYEVAEERLPKGQQEEVGQGAEDGDKSAAKEAKLKAMQARLAAWQEQQQQG